MIAVAQSFVGTAAARGQQPVNIGWRTAITADTAPLLHAALEAGRIKPRNVSEHWGRMCAAVAAAQARAGQRHISLFLHLLSEPTDVYNFCIQPTCNCNIQPHSVAGNPLVVAAAVACQPVGAKKSRACMPYGSPRASCPWFLKEGRGGRPPPAAAGGGGWRRRAAQCRTSERWQCSWCVAGAFCQSIMAGRQRSGQELARSPCHGLLQGLQGLQGRQNPRLYVMQ